MVKIGPVDPEIALLNLKKEKKLTQVKYIAWSAGLPSGLNDFIKRLGLKQQITHTINLYTRQNIVLRRRVEPTSR